MPILIMKLLPENYRIYYIFLSAAPDSPWESSHTTEDITWKDKSWIQLFKNLCNQF